MVKTEAQKKARAARRKRRKAAAKEGKLPFQAAVRGAKILEKAIEGGYVPNNPPMNFKGKGSYGMARAKLRGKGDFVDDLVGGGARILGNGIRSGLSWLTGKAGSLLSGLLGQGDYLTGGAPTANAHVMGAMPRVMGNSNDPAFVMEFVEEIASITATDVFKSTVFHIQPGLSSFLKWLPKIARSFEQYELEGMVVIYKPTIAPLNDAASGDLVISVVYDANGAVPQNITTALNSYLAVGGRPLDQMMAAVECDPKQTQTRIKFVRATDPPEDADHNLYDWGKLCISQEGQPTSTVGDAIGRLYVSYKFRFYKPLIQLDIFDVPTAHYWVASTPSTAPFGATATDFVRRSDNTFELTWIDADTFAMPSYVQEGKWMVIVQAQGFAASSAVKCSFVITGASNLLLWGSNNTTPGTTQLAFAPTDSVALNTRVMSAITLTVTSPAPTINVASQSWTGNAGVDIFVIPIDVDIAGLAARRQSWLRCNKMREEVRISNLRAEFAQVKQLRTELNLLRQRVECDEEKRSVVDVAPYVPKVFTSVDDIDITSKARRNTVRYMIMAGATDAELSQFTPEEIADARVALLPKVQRRDPSPARILQPPPAASHS